MTYSGEARPVRADIVWPTAKAVGKSGTRRVEPAVAGGIALTEKIMSPSRGFFERATIIPALFALGHIMAALTGLAGGDADTSSYL